MIIAVHNTKGGVGSTTLAAHLCALLAEGDESVNGMSVDSNRELHRWLEPLGIPCLDPDVDLSRRRGDHLVLDVQSICRPPLAPDVWVIPIANRLATEHAQALADTLRGAVLWLPTMGEMVIRAAVPAHASDAIDIAPSVPFSRAMAQACVTRTIAWLHPELADTRGVRELRHALTSVLELSELALGGGDTADSIAV